MLISRHFPDADDGSEKYSEHSERFKALIMSELLCRNFFSILTIVYPETRTCLASNRGSINIFEMNTQPNCILILKADLTKVPRQFNGGNNSVFNEQCRNNWISVCKKMNFGSHIIHKNELKSSSNE